MAGLVPAIHAFLVGARCKTWMPGPRPGMTEGVVLWQSRKTQNGFLDPPCDWPERHGADGHDDERLGAAVENEISGPPPAALLLRRRPARRGSSEAIVALDRSFRQTELRRQLERHPAPRSGRRATPRQDDLFRSGRHRLRGHPDVGGLYV